MSPKHQRVIQTDLPCETALDLAQQALGLIAAWVDQVDPDRGVVLAKGGLTSQPERVDIQVSLEPQAGGCKLSFCSQSPFGLFFSDLLVDRSNGRSFERMFKQVEALYHQEQAHPELIKPPPPMSLSARLGAAPHEQDEALPLEWEDEPSIEWPRLLLFALYGAVTLAVLGIRQGKLIQAVLSFGAAIALGAFILTQFMTTYVPPSLRFRTERERKRWRLASTLGGVAALTMGFTFWIAYFTRDWTLTWASLGASALIWVVAVLVEPRPNRRG